MTLAQSLLQRLNGSKSFLFLFCICFSFASCSLFQPASKVDDGKKKKKDQLDPIQGRNVFDPETGTYVIFEETPTEKMDTIIWKDLPSDSYPPITSASDGFVDNNNTNEVIRIDNYGSEILTSYNVSIVLPFLSHRFDATSEDVYPDSRYALNFYAGARMALDELGDEGVRLNVNVYDSKASENTIRDLLRTNPDLSNSHLIVGPYRRQNVQRVADYAKKENITFISPYSASANLSSSNPFYLQVSPTLQSHCEAITRHALEKYRSDQIVLVCREKPEEVARLKYFQDALKLEEGVDVEPFEEFRISTQSVDLAEMDLLPFLELRDTSVFILPSWSNETFIYSFLRKLDVSRDASSYIVVYGMPQWMQYEKIDYDYFEKLNVHVSSDSHIDNLSNDIQFFKRRFYDRYGAIPTSDAYLGYDVMLFGGRMLQKYGTKFQYSLDMEDKRYLHTKFNFEKVVQPGTTGQENRPVDRFENKYINILKFSDYQFKLQN
jgi:hypothetical protein